MTMTINIYENYALAELTTSVKNSTDSPVEIVVYTPLAANWTLSSFHVFLGASVLTSQVKEAVLAQQDYSNAFNKGKAAVLSELLDENKFRFIKTTIGILLPSETAEITYNIVFSLSNIDLSLGLSIDPTLLPHLNILTPISLSLNFTITTCSPLTRLICRNYAIEPKLTNNFKSARFSIDSISLKDNMIDVIFRTESMDQPLLVSQYNPRLGLYANTFSYKLDTRSYKSDTIDLDNTVSYTEKYKRMFIQQSKGIFIFLIDQSGSMAGYKMKQANEALCLFLRSLPEDSKFEIYGFGSTFVKYTDAVETATKTVVESYVEQMKNLKASLVGTSFTGPLESIFSTDFESTAKNVFLFTDGEAKDEKNAKELVDKHADSFRVHCIGIGSEVNGDFLGEIAKRSRGVYIQAYESSEIKKAVISALSVAVLPYIESVEFQVNFETELIMKSSDIFYHDDLVSFSYISFKPFDFSCDKLTVSYFDPIEMNNVLKEADIGANLLTLPSGEEVSKIIAGSFVGKSELTAKEATDLAVRYQILSEYTNLICVDPNVKQQVDEINMLEANNWRNWTEKAEKIAEEEKQEPKDNYNLEDYQFEDDLSEEIGPERQFTKFGAGPKFFGLDNNFCFSKEISSDMFDEENQCAMLKKENRNWEIGSNVSNESNYKNEQNSLDNSFELQKEDFKKDSNQGKRSKLSKKLNNDSKKESRLFNFIEKEEIYSSNVCF